MDTQIICKIMLEWSIWQHLIHKYSITGNIYCQIGLLPEFGPGHYPIRGFFQDFVAGWLCGWGDPPWKGKRTWCGIWCEGAAWKWSIGTFYGDFNTEHDHKTRQTHVKPPSADTQLPHPESSLAPFAAANLWIEPKDLGMTIPGWGMTILLQQETCFDSPFNTI